MKCSILFAIFFASVLCRHRPDIFKDDLTLGQAIENAKVAYSNVVVGSNVAEDKKRSVKFNLRGVIDTVSSAVKTAVNYVELTGCMEGSVTDATKIGAVRKNCHDGFEKFAKNLTETIKSSVAASMKTKEEKELYLLLVKQQEEMVQYLPFLPPLPVAYFYAILVILSFAVVLIVTCLGCCCCCCRGRDGK